MRSKNYSETAAAVNTPESDLEPDREQLALFIRAMLKHAAPGNYVSLRTFLDNGEDGPPIRITSKQLNGDLDTLIDAAAKDARRAANNSEPAVFSPIIATFKNAKKAREIDLVEGLALSAECDQQPQVARAKLEKLLGSPTMIVESGGEWINPETGEVEPKLHIHYRLKAPARNKEDLDLLKEARTLACELVGGDTSNITIVHPIRWPGSWHRKKEPKLTRVIFKSENEIDLDAAHKALQASVKKNDRVEMAERYKQFNTNPLNKTLTQRINDAALENLEWVSELFPDAKIRKHRKGYRIWPERNLQECISIQPPGDKDAGIKDFGAATDDDGNIVDPLKGGRTAVELVQEHLLEVSVEKLAEDRENQHKSPEFNKAFDWLAEKIGFKSEEPEQPTELFDPWAQFIVPDFPLDILPLAIQDFVVAQARVIGCDISTMAMSVMCTFSGAIDHSTSLKMMRNGDWYASPRLWVLLVGDFSKKKTPAINTATAPIEDYQDKQWRKYKLELQIAEESEEKIKVDLPIRYVVFDTTIEKLGEILTRSNRGVLVKRDEFAGWIGSMEKYGGTSRGAGANRAFWLKAYDGGPYVVDRIQRGENYVENLSTSLIGGVQPKRLAELHGLTSDGLLQRFLPVIMGASKFALDQAIDYDAYATLVKQLIEAPPRYLELSDTALQVMNDLRLHLHNIEQHTGGLAEGFQAFVGKLHGVAGSLALILHTVADPKNGSKKQAVLQKTVEDARRLIVDFLLPHALEFYRSAEDNSGGERLKKLASWILTNGKERFVISDLTSNIADFRGLTPYEVNERVAPLEAMGWVKANPDGHSWKVSPKVFTQFADQAKKEEARKAALAGLLGSPRKVKS